MTKCCFPLVNSYYHKETNCVQTALNYKFSIFIVDFYYVMPAAPIPVKMPHVAKIVVLHFANGAVKYVIHISVTALVYVAALAKIMELLHHQLIHHQEMSWMFQPSQGDLGREVLIVRILKDS